MDHISGSHGSFLLLFSDYFQIFSVLFSYFLNYFCKVFIFCCTHSESNKKFRIQSQFYNIFFCFISSLGINPTSYGIILWLLRSPLRYHGKSHFGLYIAIDHLLPGTYRGHMPIFRLISLTLNEILRLENFEKMRFFPR